MSVNIFEVMLDSFHRSAIDESPIEIMKNFLRFVIRDGALSQSGSILLYNKSKDALELFNPDDFLFKERFLQPGQNWAREMPSSQGLAGLFAGFVSFHNSPDGKPFEQPETALARRAVALLSTALRAASGRLNIESRTTFVIHGRDTAALEKLKTILTARGVTVELLGQQPRTGFQLLEKLEEMITSADGVFVLMTPDDGGRLADDRSEFERRARENVIFEAGLACALHHRSNRVCFLVVGTTNIPSDIRGLLWEKFDPARPRIERLEQVLQSWGFRWTEPH